MERSLPHKPARAVDSTHPDRLRRGAPLRTRRTGRERQFDHEAMDDPLPGHNVRVSGSIGPFARLRLTGGRFDGEGMPVEALVELVAYRELVVGVANELFREAHPDRQRVPRGFADSLQLRLQRVESGSAVPVLERVQDQQLPSLDDEFTRSRDVIEEAVAAIEGGGPLPEVFPRDALILFNRFGQTLRPDEGIELRRGSASSGPRFTPDIRRSLVLTQRRTYLQEVDDVGWVTEMDADRMSCRVRLRFGPTVPVSAPLDEITFAPVKEVLEPNGEGPPVRISGVGVFDADRGLVRFDSIHEVAFLDDAEELSKLESRFSELVSLREGWLDGEGVPPDIVVLRRARRVLADLLDFDVPRPRVFATLEGGVQAEWSVEGHEVSVTFEPDGTLYAISVNRAAGTSDEPTLALDDPERIAQFVLRQVS